MHTNQLARTLAGGILGVGLVGLVIITAVSCQSPRPVQAGPDPAPSELTPYGPYPAPPWREASHASLQVPLPQIADAEVIGDNEICATCHGAQVKAHKMNVHRDRLCEDCHGPGSKHVRSRGQEPGSILSFKTLSPPQRSEVCLKCHEQNNCSIAAEWRTSAHASHGVSCTECHTAHYNVPAGTPAAQLAQDTPNTRPEAKVKLVRLPQPGDTAEDPDDMASIRVASQHLGAITPHICYRCHGNLARQQELAATHQICGAIGFDCATCHDPHGKIRPETRVDLCLKCHDNNSPTMAWHSSSHARFGVACVDCHNPHPNTTVPKVVNVQHTNVREIKRAPMEVNEPYVCYKCHAGIYAKTSMPSHHPIKEGKITCSDCHDPHGQTQDNLKQPTVNMVCYKCHADKQGPYAYEHPPVTEDCTICHDPHGAVANNLLHQPTTFLCLRCHTGHRKGPNFHDATYLGDVGTNPALQRAFYTDCTQCHAQIHGSDVPSPHLPNAKFR